MNHFDLVWRYVWLYFEEIFDDLSNLLLKSGKFILKMIKIRWNNVENEINRKIDTIETL